MGDEKQKSASEPRLNCMAVALDIYKASPADQRRATTLGDIPLEMYNCIKRTLDGLTAEQHGDIIASAPPIVELKAPKLQSSKETLRDLAQACLYQTLVLLVDGTKEPVLV